MGNWYKNITTLGPTQADVAAWCARHDRQAYVTPTRDGVTVVFDREVDQAADPGELGDLAFLASMDLGCPVLPTGHTRSGCRPISRRRTGR